MELEAQNTKGRADEKLVAVNPTVTVNDSRAAAKVSVHSGPIKDTTAARVARFAAGSVFGLVFLVACFVMLTTALKGPDAVNMDGVNLPSGLVQENKNPGHVTTGKPAPDFVLNQLGGNGLQLSKLQGKTVLINFWASWCQPCIDEMPDLQKFYQTHRGDSVQVLTVNYKEPASAAKGFFKDHSLTMPVAMDTTGKVAAGYGIQQFPESYFVDKNGIVQDFSYGPMSLTDMENKLNHVWQVSGK